MGEQRHNREPKLARTDFESMTHEQLAALLASANTAGASHLSSKLSKAASTITKIGDDLMTYVKGLEWQGEGGDAFRDWGGQTASSTLRLGQYAEVAARWMGTVSQAIAEAKAAMPDVSETTRAKTDLADAHKTITAANQPGGHNDPDAQKLAATARTDAAAAEHRMEAARGEAIQQLRKLAQTYEYSAQQVNSVPPPTFSPPVGQAGNDNWWVGESKEHLPSPPTHTGNGSVGATLSSRQGGGSHSHTVSPGGSTKSADGLSSESGSRDRGQTPPVSMDIDSTGTLSRETPTIGVPTSPGTGQSHREVSLPQQSAPVPPTVASGGRAFPQNPSAQGHAAPRLPQPQGNAGQTGSTPRGSRGTGIVGGRPVANAGRPTGGIPRGTVVGKDNLQGRTSMGRAVSSSSSISRPNSPGTIQGNGRRLASEAGGIVGARPGQPGRTGSRPFTSGGSGLLRSPANASDAAHGVTTGRAVGPGTPSGTRKVQQRDGQRPDYLVEDEETWTRGNRASLPPVVD
ncbi:hypothetical protein PV620_29625 [Streptomyces sp. ME02-6978a]|uniref:WXG100 family type VII secretion target n=1 Tax=unclassified Streptomyces TaxID=2593676 RepID=UPI0029B0E822|nr:MULTISPECIES: hypothetical protein [unclassified Streptomyces]MDX3092342.1 hypothetical protein [Streptomyces sp. ME12-02E]MDX3335707.1 hypothetical protein [Streptomyces sp. ME02-6978a]